MIYQAQVFVCENVHTLPQTTTAAGAVGSYNFFFLHHSEPCVFAENNVVGYVDACVGRGPF